MAFDSLMAFVSDPFFGIYISFIRRQHLVHLLELLILLDSFISDVSLRIIRMSSTYALCCGIVKIKSTTVTCTDVDQKYYLKSLQGYSWDLFVQNSLHRRVLREYYRKYYRHYSKE